MSNIADKEKQQEVKRILMGLQEQQLSEAFAECKNPKFRIRNSVVEFSQNKIYGKFGVYGCAIGGTGQLQGFDAQGCVVLGGKLGVGEVTSSYIEDSELVCTRALNSVMHKCRLTGTQALDSVLRNCEIDGTVGDVLLKGCVIRECMLPYNVSCIDCIIENCVIADLTKVKGGKITNSLIFNFEVVTDKAEVETVWPNVHRLDSEKFGGTDFRYYYNAKWELPDELIGRWESPDEGNAMLFGNNGIFKVAENSEGFLMTGPTGIPEWCYVMQPSEEMVGTAICRKIAEEDNQEDLYNANRKHESKVYGGLMMVGSGSPMSFVLKRGNQELGLVIDGQISYAGLQGSWDGDMLDGKSKLNWCTRRGLMWKPSVEDSDVLRGKLQELDKYLEQWRGLIKGSFNMMQQNPNVRVVIEQEFADNANNEAFCMRKILQICSSSSVLI